MFECACVRVCRGRHVMYTIDMDDFPSISLYASYDDVRFKRRPRMLLDCNLKILIARKGAFVGLVRRTKRSMVQVPVRTKKFVRSAILFCGMA